MTVNVLYFGYLADHTKRNSEAVDAGTVEELNKLLKEKYPGIEQYKYSVAVNQEIVHNDRPFTENDEVALLPPFAGG